MKRRFLFTLTMSLIGMAACAPGGKKVESSITTYEQFFQRYTDVMSRLPGAREVRCSPFAGPPLDYRYATCFYYPSSISVEAVQQALVKSGFALKPGAGGPKAVRVYDAKGGDHFVSQAELEAENGSVLVGSLIADTGLYVGQVKSTDQWAEVSLLKAAQQVSAQLARGKNKVTPCKQVKADTVCLSVADRKAFLDSLAGQFYAGEPANFLKKYRTGPFKYQGDEVWKPGEKGYGAVALSFSKSGGTDIFLGKDAQTYRNMLFTVTLDGATAIVTANYRPGYKPADQK